MLISLKWLSDFVEIPDGVDPVALGERFTVTTAEVDGVHPVHAGVKGLVAAKISSLAPIASNSTAKVVTVDVGGPSLRAVSQLKNLSVGDKVIFAPAGAKVGAFGEINSGQMFGERFDGVIVPAEALGMEAAAQEAVVLGPEMQLGANLANDLFDDWLIEIDNKSLTNRPDLWGHYGIARELAALLRLPLKPYPVVGLDAISIKKLPDVPILIADPKACPRYSGIVLEGVPTQPAPLWMQVRLGRIGMRPISGLVDLTNYIMADLGQPMHAFDAAKVDRIEVDWAREGERFRTLDGVERVLRATDLMIKCAGRSVALAGVMGGLETEVSPSTTSLLLESANFEPATIRRTAKRLGLRSEASARFEKGLDPANTVLAIQRFLYLAKEMYPSLGIVRRLSDSYPAPRKPCTVSVKPANVQRVLGRSLELEQARSVLEPLGFKLTEGASEWLVQVPSFRATGDIGIEEDVLEELARCTGYGAIVPTMPRVTARHFEPNPLREVEHSAIDYFTRAAGFHEIHGYVWYDAQWLQQLRIDPGECVELMNPAGEGLHLLRKSLMPGLLRSVARNRFHFPSLALLETGSVFKPASNGKGESEFQHLGLVLAQRGRLMEPELMSKLKGTIQAWSWERFGQEATFHETTADVEAPWELAGRTAEVRIGKQLAGRVSYVDAGLRQAMDEHLLAWGIVWAELGLSALAEAPRVREVLNEIPPFPLVEMDFSILVPRTSRYAEVSQRIAGFEHPLLRSIRYVVHFEGESTGLKRSITFRTVLGDATRTLTDQDATEFRQSFIRYLTGCGFELRAG